ncbi:AAA family ATPase [Paenibacillus sp. NPDC057967]|uniref:AAA family ATPase n=1 Tax=Paenibacillus sp. NPDC057967 TaxID=3346293 RepID=UPI0036DB3ED2
MTNNGWLMTYSRNESCRSAKLIWINGAFGAGKTQAAHELCRRLPDSYLYDPENMGYFLRKHMPSSVARGDFQDFPAWRECNYAILKMLHEEYEGPIIVPMTIVDTRYFEELVGRLRADGIEVVHVALCASRDVLLARLKKRREGASSWAAQQIDRCVQGLQQETFLQQIDTDRMSMDEVVEEIATIAGIQLQPDRRSKLQKWKDRWSTQLKHIRWF